MGTHDKQPCCVAEALRRIRQVEINGIPTGIAMLDNIFDEVNTLNLANENEITEVLMRRVKVYNHVPNGAYSAYAGAILSEYSKECERKRI